MLHGPSALIYHGGSPGSSGKYASGPGPSADELVKVSAADTTASYLNSKLNVNGRLAKVILNPAGNEILEIQGGDHFTLVYNNMDNGIVAGDFLRPPDYNRPPTGVNYSGCYYSDSGFAIKKIAMCIQEFDTTAVRQIQFRLREYIADGTKLTAFATGEGNIVGTVFYNIPDTLGIGSPNYYMGGYDNVDWSVSSGYGLFAYVLASSVDICNGISLWLHCYKYPI